MKNVIFTLLFSGFMYIYTVLFLYSRVLQVYNPEVCKYKTRSLQGEKYSACRSSGTDLLKTEKWG